MPRATKREAKHGNGANLGFEQMLWAAADKLRNNNETLEAIAQAIFESWFVDFDPVRRNVARCHAERRSPGSSQKDHPFPPRESRDPLLSPSGRGAGGEGRAGSEAFDHLFPHAFQESAAERVPKWARAGDATSGKWAFRAGEILFGKLRPYFHKVGVAPVDGVCSTDILVIAPREQKWFSYVLGPASGKELVAYADMLSTGTKMPRTSWRDLAAYEVVLLAQAVAAAYDRIVSPRVDMMRRNIMESHPLAALRDTLLPKLMSGEVRVRHAEDVVAQAAQS